MTEFDWERLRKINIDEINEDNAEVLYDFLSETDVENVEDPKKLQHAFGVVQAMMITKFEQHKIVEEELTAKNDEIKNLKMQNYELENENKDLQRFGADSSNRDLIQEKRDWQIDRDRLENEVYDLKSRLSEASKEKEDLVSAHGDLKQKLDRLTEENSRMNENCIFLKNQIEQLRMKANNAAKGDDFALRKELSNMRSELRSHKAKIDSLEEEKHQQWEDIQKLEQNLREATFEMEKSTEEYRQMKIQLLNSDKIAEEKEAECQLLKAKVEDLNALWNQRGDSDDQIMIALNQKVEEWKDLLAERDTENYRLYEENRRLRQELQASGVDSDKASMAAMFKALKEKEEQIRVLEEQMVQATKEIERDALAMREMQDEMNATGRGPSERQAERIREMRLALKDKDDMIRALDQRREEAEKDVIDKDRELFDANERMRRYEDGEYGLAEAVAEIKTAKSQIASRDRQIEELCNQINRAEMSRQELKLENEHLRGKLGIGLADDLDIEGYKRSKFSKEEEDKAQSVVLLKEIESLEDERLLLKKKLRLLARQAGLKAAANGMSVDNFIDLDILDDEDQIDPTTNASKQRSAPRMSSLRPVGSMQNLNSSAAAGANIRLQELNKELDWHIKELDVKGTEINRLQNLNESLAEENNTLVIALREIHDKLKDFTGPTKPTSGTAPNNTRPDYLPSAIECPALDKLLSALDAKRITGELDTGLYMKARVDNLEGRNDELRKELREHRIQQGKTLADLERYKERLHRAEEELKALYDIGGGQGGLRTLALPEGISPSNAEIISALSEHLVQTLQELSNREEASMRHEQALQQYRRKFAVCRHQQGLLYRQYIDEKKVMETEKARLDQRLQDVEGARQEERVRLQEFDRLVDSLSQDDVEVRRRLAEQTRQITVLRVNECALVRRYQAVQEMEQTLRRENNRLRNEQMQMEAIVMERIGYYQRYKEMAAYRVSSLQKSLDDSVPKMDLARVQRQLDTLTERHRAFLESQNANISRLNSLDQLEVELKQTRLEHENVKKMLLSEKERRAKLEMALEEWSLMKEGNGSMKSPNDNGTSVPQNQLLQLSQKLTMLEMKELNERERADHAQRLYENLKLNWAEVERRNNELEEKFGSVSAQILEQQKIERLLRDDLANSVTREVYDLNQKRLLELEKSEMNLKHEVDKLKEISDIAVNQCRSIQGQQVSQDKELTSLRQQLLDIQCQTDEKALIGKLHRHIVHMQLSESTSLRKLEEANRKIHRLDAHLLRQEHKLDDREQSLYHTRLDSRNRVRHLRETISSLRQKYAGSIPLKQQEKFTESLLNLQRDKAKAEEALREARRTHDDVSDELEKLKIQHQGLQELMATLKDGRGAAKVQEWQAKMEQLRLDELKYRRQVERLRQQLNHVENVIRSQETQLCQLEEENVRLNREWEERQLLWEQREAELERALASLESVEQEVVGAANRLEAASAQPGGGLPDPTQPISTQLEQAVVTIKRNLKTIFDQQSESKELKNQIKILQEQFKDAERSLLKRDRLIAELRLRLPASSDRDNQFREMTNSVMNQINKEDNLDIGNYVEQKTTEAAQTTIQSLQTRLQQKEASLQRYQELLHDARTELESMSHKHAQEILRMQQKLNHRNQEGVERLKDSVRDLQSRQKGDSLTSKQISRLAELEELLVEYSRKITELNEDSKAARQMIGDWQKKYDQMLKASEAEKEMILNQQRKDKKFYEEDLRSWKIRLEEKSQEIALRDADIARLQSDIKKSPNAQTRTLVQRLKAQLDEKEKQHEALSKALMELRRDMVSQAEETLKQTGLEQNQQGDLQRILERHSDDIARELLSTREALQKANAEMKKAKDSANAMECEIQDLKDDKARKETSMQRLRADKNKAEREKDDLSKQLERLKNVRRIGPAGSKQNLNDVSGELDLLKRKCHLLEEENRWFKERAEKPYEQDTPQRSAALVDASDTTGLEPTIIQEDDFIQATQQSRQQAGRMSASPNRRGNTSNPTAAGGDAKPTDAVSQWEENKRLQRVIDKMKETGKMKELEVEKVTKQLELTKNALERANKEKEVLEARVTKRLGPAGTMMDLPDSEYALPGAKTASGKRKNANGPAVHDMEEMRRRCFSLEQENERLKRHISEKEKGRSETTFGNDVKHRLLQERIDQLERQLITKGGLSSASMERERSMQKELVRLNEENLEMKFELQAAHKEVPRSKKRIEDLEKYIELLKAEKAAALENSTVRSFDSQSSVTVGNLRRIGESGKSSKELEKTIARLKKVVERVQAENERLKTAPGIVSQEQVQWLRNENETLKRQLDEMRDQMGRKLTDRYDSKDRAVTKLVGENERLQKDLDREIMQHKQTKNQLFRAEQELLEARRRTDTSSTNRFNATKSQLDWENEVQSREQALGDMRKMLREAAERELAWNRQKEDLQKQLTMYTATAGLGNNMNTTQLTRKVQELSEERDLLATEIKGLTSSTSFGNDLGQKLAENEKLLRENIDLRMQLNQLNAEKSRMSQDNAQLSRQIKNSAQRGRRDEIPTYPGAGGEG